VGRFFFDAVMLKNLFDLYRAHRDATGVETLRNGLGVGTHVGVV
jgi:hypothetical protein